MFEYFKELLATLKSIDASLKEITGCITDYNHKNAKSIRTQNWNS